MWRWWQSRYRNHGRETNNPDTVIKWWNIMRQLLTVNWMIEYYDRVPSFPIYSIRLCDWLLRLMLSFPIYVIDCYVEEFKPKETLFKPNNVDLVKLSVTVLLLHSIIEKHVPTRWLSLYHFHQRSYHLSISYLRPILTVLDADDDNPTEFETYTVKTKPVPKPTYYSRCHSEVLYVLGGS